MYKFKSKAKVPHCRFEWVIINGKAVFIHAMNMKQNETIEVLRPSHIQLTGLGFHPVSGSVKQL